MAIMVPLDIESLGVDERLELIDEIWMTLDRREARDFPLSPEQLQEFDRRMEEHRLHPERAIPWVEVRDRLSAHNAILF